MKNNKYSYYKVIQQNYGQGWEDVSYYVTKSNYIVKEQSHKLSPAGRKESILSHDVREYKIMGYPTRVIDRKELNKN